MMSALLVQLTTAGPVHPLTPDGGKICVKPSYTLEEPYEGLQKT